MSDDERAPHPGGNGNGNGNGRRVLDQAALAEQVQRAARDARGRWMKGQSANPATQWKPGQRGPGNGPKPKPKVEIKLRELGLLYLNQPWNGAPEVKAKLQLRDDCTIAEAWFASMVHNGMRGKPTPLREVNERIWGKIKSHVVLEDKRTERLADLSTDELLSYMTELRDKLVQ